MLIIDASAAICSLLDNWSGMDREKAKEYIVNCQVCLVVICVVLDGPVRLISFSCDYISCV